MWTVTDRVHIPGRNECRVAVGTEGLGPDAVEVIGDAVPAVVVFTPSGRLFGFEVL